MGCSALLVHDGTARPPKPVCSLEEVDEVDAERLFGLAHLPILTTAALQFLAEPTHLVGQWLVRRGPCEEPEYPAHAVRRRFLCHQLRLEDKLSKLLQRRLQLSHRFTSPHWWATGMPIRVPWRRGWKWYSGHGFSMPQAGSRRCRAIRWCLMTTEGDANTVNWRLPPIHGNFGLCRRNQSTTRASAARGNPLCKWHLTWEHLRRRMAAEDRLPALARVVLSAGTGNWRCPDIQRSADQIAKSKVATDEDKPGT